MRILRGVALNIYGDSYLDRMQRIAELESTLKVNRFVRDIPKFERGTDNWVQEMISKNEESNSEGKNKEEEPLQFQR